LTKADKIKLVISVNDTNRPAILHNPSAGSFPCGLPPLRNHEKKGKSIRVELSGLQRKARPSKVTFPVLGASLSASLIRRLAANQCNHVGKMNKTTVTAIIGQDL